MQNNLDILFKDFYFIDKKYPIFKGILPKTIFEEIDIFVNECRKYKDNPLGFLKYMPNAGNNDFQCFVPFSLVNSSIFYSYIYYLGNKYVSKINKPLNEVKLIKKYFQSYDSYDLWVNFSSYNNDNPVHTHLGEISGIIYFLNPENTPTIFNEDLEYIGKPGEILLFPSKLAHSVPPQKTNKERVTLSFNLG
jgi:hypothetical protein